MDKNCDDEFEDQLESLERSFSNQDLDLSNFTRIQAPSCPSFKLLKFPASRKTSLLRGSASDDRGIAPAKDFWATQCSKHESSADQVEEQQGNEEREEEMLMWVDWVATGSNLLLYGVGSKSDLLSELEIMFKREFKDSENCNVIRFDGYRDSISAIADRLPGICKKQKKQRGEALYATHYVVVIIDSIDGPRLRHHQSEIIQLVHCYKVRLVVSVDHLAYPLLWSTAEIEDLNFLHLHVPTLKPYKSEIELRWNGQNTPSWIACQPDSDDQINSIKAALSAFPPKQKELYKTMVQLAIENRKPSHEDNLRVSKAILAKRSIESLIVDNVTKIQETIQEFTDHKLISSYRDHYVILASV